MFCNLRRGEVRIAECCTFEVSMYNEADVIGRQKGLRIAKAFENPTFA
jgi:hypothetical protein